LPYLLHACLPCIPTRKNVSRHRGHSPPRSRDTGFWPRYNSLDSRTCRRCLLHTNCIYTFTILLTCLASFSPRLGLRDDTMGNVDAAHSRLTRNMALVTGWLQRQVPGAAPCKPAACSYHPITIALERTSMIHRAGLPSQHRTRKRQSSILIFYGRRLYRTLAEGYKPQEPALVRY